MGSSARLVERIVFAMGLAAAVAAGTVAYQVRGSHGERGEYDPRVRRIYDPATGTLQVIVFDASGNLRFDTWSYMDGERLLRLDTDDDEDGAIDRRQFYGPDQELERMEYLSTGGQVTKTEFYSRGVLVRTAAGRIHAREEQEQAGSGSHRPERRAP